MGRRTQQTSGGTKKMEGKADTTNHNNSPYPRLILRGGNPLLLDMQLPVQGHIPTVMTQTAT